jgi:MFS family permease
VARSRTLAALFAFLALTGLGEGVMAALFAPFVVAVLGGGDLAYGWLLSAQAVGGVVGSAVIARWGAAIRPVRLIGLGAIAGGGIDLLIFNGPALLPGLTLPLVLMVVVGVPFSAMSIGRATLVQTATADQYRGRVLGALQTTAALSTLLGTVAGGLLGDHVGIVAMLNVDGVVYCLAGIMLLVALRSAPIATPARAT